MSLDVCHPLETVYGVSRRVPLTYISRTYVDDVFSSNLRRQKHIVVYGGSKQGKTSLRKNCLRDEESVIVQCASATSRERLYELILKEAGASVEVSSSLTVSGSHKLGVKISGEGKIPLLAKASGEGVGERGKSRTRQQNYTNFEIDPADVNDVIRVLESIGFKKHIVLEDFHYLPEEIQKEIAIDLKAFHEKSELSFIIIGVWLESNRLEMYNGDLTGRLVSINADRWEHTDLEKVIHEGQHLLNVVFNESAKAHIVKQCQDNVGLLQDICYRLCEAAQVFETSAELRTVGAAGEVLDVLETIVEQQAGRYNMFLREFSHGFQTTELDMYRWIAYAVVTSQDSDLRRGLKLATIHRIIESVHPKGEGALHRNSVLQALANVRRLQQKKQIRPIILDYDSSNNLLSVVDIGFILYLNSRPHTEVLALIECDDVEQPLALPERRTRRRRVTDRTTSSRDR
jgi:hypothetical protein